MVEIFPFPSFHNAFPATIGTLCLWPGKPLQLVQFGVHGASPEAFSIHHEDNHSYPGEANGESHPCHKRWNKSIFDCPVVVIENHTELDECQSRLCAISWGETYAKCVLGYCGGYHNLARNVLVAVDCIL